MAPTPRPLEGKTVIDFTQIGAGPTCTMILADLGARVIKIEPPEGDIGRTLGPGWIDGVAALFHGFNRNKQGLTLDLKSEAGPGIALRLIARADIVVESMRPGVMDRLGLSEAACKAVRPDLVYCSISAYGQTGPYSRRAGVDGIMQADSGLMSLIGFPDTGPAKVQTPIVDVFTGYVAACGVLASLMIRQGDARPQLDISLFQSAIALQQASLTSYLADGDEPRKQGSAAPGLATSRERVTNRQDMVAALAQPFSRRTSAEWFAVLSEADILCAPVATYADLVRHPQVVHGNLFGTAERPAGEPVAMPAPAIRFNGTERSAMTAAPTINSDPRSVLAGLGFSDDEIAIAIASNSLGPAR
ncbi:CoA transferase [Sulfitobacter sp. PR48]|uniref:CaiB/BaiF CoA transferase family protein n=1 Tax=Sulfitobacter sp. PR48 TaxID=3028383 RepID=UPI00237BC568|nr:CoA transferase [Sulfitobacter sp. PR48]MDD9723611.1 CoA transferase [Sulfitobacter sp. PR48]